MSQPLNATISVNRRVRSYRNMRRHEAVLAMTGGMRELVMSVPAEEVLVTETRITSGAGSLITNTSVGGINGLPIVRQLRDATTLAEAVAGMSNIDFAIVIGDDKFLDGTSGHEGDDIQQDLRDVQ